VPLPPSTQGVPAAANFKLGKGEHAMFLPLQSKPAARGVNRRPWANKELGLSGLLPQQDDGYAADDFDGAGEALDSEDSAE
jgi:hypothetical protein